jgi:hypothetical protein
MRPLSCARLSQLLLMTLMLLTRCSNSTLRLNFYSELVFNYTNAQTLFNILCTFVAKERFLPCRRLAMAVSSCSTVLAFSYHVTALYSVVTAVKTSTQLYETITLPEILHMCEIWSRRNYLIVRGRV